MILHGFSLRNVKNTLKNKTTYVYTKNKPGQKQIMKKSLKNRLAMCLTMGLLWGLNSESPWFIRRTNEALRSKYKGQAGPRLTEMLEAYQVCLRSTPDKFLIAGKDGELHVSSN